MIYLDCSANTPVDPAVLDAFCRTEQTYIGNPNSAHPAGRAAQAEMARATEDIAALLGVSPEEIIYTSGASESNNLALKGIAQASRHVGRHILSTALEHSSVGGALSALQQQGCEVDLVDIGRDGTSGKRGTSCMAMMFLSSWINGFGQTGRLPISSQYLSGAGVNFSQNGPLRDALRRGGAAVVRLDLEGWHYVLLTQIRGDQVFLFDPYYQAEPFGDPALQMVAGHPAEYNRIIPVRCMERAERDVYALGPAEGREAVILFNDKTVLTADKTVEYII